MSIVAEICPAQPAPPPFDDNDFAELVLAVDELQDTVTELIKVAQSQHTLIGMLMDQVMPR